jgi:RHS repeat-associated protein
MSGLPISKNGYLFVYLSYNPDRSVGDNGSEYTNLFFDNLVVQHYTGPLVEETQYYPFGLTQQGISSRAFGRLENKKKFNGYEENKSLSLNWLESFYRTYDPQLGRFWQTDPLPKEHESLYAGMANNPVLCMDINGADTTVTAPDGSCKSIEGKVTQMFSGEPVQLVSSGKTIRPAANSVRSFVIKNMFTDPEGARFIAIFGENSGTFLGYFWDKDISYSLDDFYTHIKKEVETVMANPEIMEFKNSEAEARMSRLSLSIGLALPTVMIRPSTIASVVSKITGSGSTAAKTSTRFVSTAEGVVHDLQPTLNRIASGGKFPHRNDGSIFKNMEGLLPKQNTGYYREFVHPTPGVNGPGAMRVVTGQNGQMWFTPDHYKTFIPIR